MLLYTIFFYFVLWNQQAFAQPNVCPANLTKGCNCEDLEFGPFIHCQMTPNEAQDIQITFDKVSDAFENSVVDTVVLEIIPTGPEIQVPANSVSNLKTKTLIIRAGYSFTKIDSDAFPGSHKTAEMLSISEMKFQNSHEIFKLANNFKQLQLLDLYKEFPLSEIPAEALGRDLRNLKTVYIDTSEVKSIGARAFYGPPNLDTVSMTENNLNLADIEDTAFEFSGQDVMLILERNSGLTHLPKEKFEKFLNNNNNALFVGPGCAGGCSCNLQYALHCDERMDWVCQNTNFTRLYGYWCKEQDGLVDIFGYCAQKFGQSMLERIQWQNINVLKRIERADHMRREEHRIEQKYFRYLAPFRQPVKANSACAST